jgi:DNA-binding beta-propeller fold protein YncE
MKRFCVGLLVCALVLGGAGLARADYGFVYNIGSAGGGDGQFRYPLGVAVDGSGNAFVADLGNGRIQVFANDGTFLGVFGYDELPFFGPAGLALDPNGNIFVTQSATDTGMDRVAEFNPDDTLLITFAGEGSGDGELLNPVGIALDADGKVFIADSGNGRVMVFANDGTFLYQIGTFGNGDGQFYFPEGIAIDADGDVYVTDLNSGRGNSPIQVFRNDGTFLARIGTFGTGDGQFDSPVGIALDPAGNIFVADFRSDQVQVLASDGTFLTKFGTAGSGDGQLQQPTFLALDPSGNVFVTDSGNNRIVVFAPE